MLKKNHPQKIFGKIAEIFSTAKTAQSVYQEQKYNIHLSFYT
jgi:hypothetical protein